MMGSQDSPSCPLCGISMLQWTAARKTLHLGACCEKTMSTCDNCPGCHKSLVNQIPRSHLKQCASRIKMKLIDFMALSAAENGPAFHPIELKRYIPASCTAPDGTTDEDMQTAVALSLSAIEEDRQRKFEAKLGARLHPTDVGPPSHLLLSEKQRCAIFSERLATIILQTRPVPQAVDRTSSRTQSRYRRKFWDTPHLWRLASQSNSSGAASSEEDEQNSNSFYVDALIPPISPAKSRWGSHLLSLSQIPGRSATKIRARFTKTDEVVISNDDPPNMKAVTPNCDDAAASVICLPSPSKTLSQDPPNMKALPPNSDDVVASVICISSPDNSPPPKPDRLPCHSVGPSSRACPPSNSTSRSTSRFRSMVGENICADSWLILDSGDPVPAHRFVFAAWRILDRVFPDNLDTAFVTGVVRNELFDLLHVLYEGDENQFRHSVTRLTPSIQALASSWGLPFPNTVPPLSTANLVNDTSPKLAGSEHFIVPSIQRDDQTSHILNNNTNPQLDHPSPSTPMVTPCANTNNSIVPTVPISAQFSRDLFSPVDEELEEDKFCLYPVPIVQEKEVEMTNMSNSPGTITAHSSVLTPFGPPLFDDQPTPGPLFKRIRLSDEASVTRTEVTELTESIIDSVMCEPMFKESLAFTPASNSASVENVLVLSPEAKLANPALIERTPLTECTTTLSCQSPVTPLPNYVQMMTPELKHALSIYGVRPLPRKRAVKLLNEIYNELHRYESNYVSAASLVSQSHQTSHGTVNTETTKPQQLFHERIDLNSSSFSQITSLEAVHQQTTSALRPEQCAPGTDPPGIPVVSNDDACSSTRCEFEVDEPSEESDGENTNELDMESAVLNFLEKNDDLYQNVLIYTPIEFDIVHAMLKSSGIRISARKLMDILDNQCIPFTLRNRSRGQSKARSTRVMKKRTRY